MFENLALTLLIFGHVRAAVWVAWWLVKDPRYEATLMLSGGDWRSPSLWAVVVEQLLCEVRNGDPDPDSDL